MNKTIPFILQGSNIVLFINNAPVIVNETHINYAKLKEAIKAEDWEAVESLATVKSAVAKLSSGRVQVSEDEVLFDGKAIHNALTTRMLKMFAEGFSIKHFCKFMENLEENPSYRARNELYGFLEACNLPITDDGCFLAYKKIKGNWMDCYTGTIDNSVGSIVKMNRRDVNENPNETCSAGLHVCSYSYLKSYSGERIVAVKVNPRDVVSVPLDYDNAKMRVCEYLVVEELPFDQAQNDDILSAGPAVRTGYSQTVPVKKSYSVENVLNNIELSDFKKLCDELEVDFSYYYNHYANAWEYEELIGDVKIGTIRKAIDKLGLA